MVGAQGINGNRASWGKCRCVHTGDFSSLYMGSSHDPLWAVFHRVPRVLRGKKELKNMTCEFLEEDFQSMR